MDRKTSSLGTDTNQRDSPLMGIFINQSKPNISHFTGVFFLLKNGLSDRKKHLMMVVQMDLAVIFFRHLEKNLMVALFLSRWVCVIIF